MKQFPKGPRRLVAGVGWSLLGLPLLGTALVGVIYGVWPLALIEGMLFLGVAIKAWAACFGVYPYPSPSQSSDSSSSSSSSSSM